MHKSLNRRSGKRRSLPRFFGLWPQNLSGEDKYSLEVQREYLESFAKREGLEIFKVHQGDGISGYSTERTTLR